MSDAVVHLSSAGNHSVDPQLPLRIESRVRLVRTADRSILYDHTRSWSIRKWHRFGEWAEDDGRLLREGIERTRRTLSQKIVEHVLLVYHDERAKVSERGEGPLGNERWSDFPELPPRSSLVWGLAPIDPPVLRTPAEVRSLRPTFAWQPFPGWVEIPQGHGPEPPPMTVPFVPADLERVRNVTYEIQIRDGGNLVYARRDLPEPRHRIGHVLEPGTTYRWAIRAWFELDGETRASEWSQLLRRNDDETIFTAGWQGFFFQTPTAE